MEFGRELVCDLLASWTMEFGLRRAHDVHTQVFAQLASISRTGLRAASELDSVTKFGFNWRRRRRVGIQDAPEVGSLRRSDAVSLGVEVAADLHRVARHALVDEVVGRRLGQEGVLAVAHAPYSLVVVLHERRRLVGRHERPHALVHRYRRLLHAVDATRRSAHLLPVLRTRTSKYRSFIHHGLTHYQPKSK